MRGNKLLVCIAFHYVEERRKYVESLIKRLSAYPLDVTIIVDTNRVIVPFNGAITDVHPTLKHPWHLTWMHRSHFKTTINDYDWFMYLEDDMDVPYENFKEYVDNFDMLWARNCVPSFVRLETFNGKTFVTDVTSIQEKRPVIVVGGKEFIILKQPYHAFWIMPQDALYASMHDNFTRVEMSRETAASYPMWELRKKPLIRIENSQISPLCYSWHLTNNYAEDPNTPFAKIEINNLLQ
jgi:hypothetical protein